MSQLELPCDASSDDQLRVFPAGGGSRSGFMICIDSEDPDDKAVRLSPESATKLRDALTDWLEGQ